MSSRISATMGLLLLNMSLGLHCSATSTEAECLASAPRRTDNVAVVNPSSVCVPETVFVAVRRGSWKGAVRFIELRDLNASRVEGCARYEVYTLDNRTKRFTKSTGVVSSLGSVGVHPVVVERGNQTIRGRGIAIRYAHPGCLSLMADHQLELALTPWRPIEDVNIDDERLQWFSFDASGMRSSTIPLDELLSRFD
jgi:hypothetical protein